MYYINQVRDFICDNFLYGDGAKLTNNTSFLESGIIDSTGILELISYLESTFGITIKDEELIPENLDSLININRFLGQKLAEPEKPAYEMV